MLKSINGLRDIIQQFIVTISFAAISIVLLSATQSCRSTKVIRTNKNVEKILAGKTFENHHSGFLMVDPSTRDTLINSSGSRYFIPASNVKIATLYTTLKLIPQQLPTIQYAQTGDSLFFTGLGNPTSLHPHFNDSILIKFLDRFPSLFFSASNMSDTEWAPGWAWEDFDLSFAPERSSLPLFGNTVMILPDAESQIVPAYFRDSISRRETQFYRDKAANNFFIPPDHPDTLLIPIKLRPDLTKELLEFELSKKVKSFKHFPNGSEKKILYGISRDTVLKRMMFDSDNFLAEQMLLMASSGLSDTLSSSHVIKHVKEQLLNELRHDPRWVDGSGLSRYNLFTPESLVFILSKLYSEYDWDYLKQFFPLGGKSGTLIDDFHFDSEPYLFAKSGSFGNTYGLSGYLITKSGRILIFSFMNNNFNTKMTKRIKNEMQLIFDLVRDQY